MSTNNNNRNRAALVTGANAGIGFETAAQLAEMGYGRIILACRTEVKAANARKQLIERTGKDVFELLAVDVAEATSSTRAAQQLIKTQGQIDLLILNAGLGSQTLQRSSEGVELTLAASLFGHHILTMKLLEANKLSANAHIVIAGSEGARGHMPNMPKYDYSAIQSEIGGNLDAAMDAVARGEQPAKYRWDHTYGNTKAWVAWWAAALSRQLPDGMVVVAVSPGSNPDTNFDKNMSKSFQMMMKMMKLLGPVFKLAGPTADGAKRYIDAGDFGPESSGKFYGSPMGKFIGPMALQEDAHFFDQQLQDAAWRSVVRLSGVGFPERVPVAA